MRSARARSRGAQGAVVWSDVAEPLVEGTTAVGAAVAALQSGPYKAMAAPGVWSSGYRIYTNVRYTNPALAAQLMVGNLVTSSALAANIYFSVQLFYPAQWSGEWAFVAPGTQRFPVVLLAEGWTCAIGIYEKTIQAREIVASARRRGCAAAAQPRARLASPPSRTCQPPCLPVARST